MLTCPWYYYLKLRKNKSSLRYFADSLAKNVLESRVALKRIFQEMIILRRIFNYSEEDKSGNDSSEEDKSKEDNQLF